MFWRRNRDRDLERELHAHLDLEAEEHGGDRLAARRALGNAARIQEDTRAMWNWTRWTQIGRDLRLAARMLRRRPIFTAIAILSLAIGIGANTAIFSFVNAILIRTLPVEGADRMVILRQYNELFKNENCCFRQDVVRGLQREDFGFDELFGVSSDPVMVRDRGQSERLTAEFVTPNYFAALGLRPAAGRLLDANDDTPGSAVAVISHRLWTERYGAQPDAIGRRVEIDGTPFQIVGVTPPGFSGLSLNLPRDLQIPAAMMAPMKQGNRLEVIGRLRPGVSQEQAIQRLSVTVKAIQKNAGQRVGDRDDIYFADGSQGLWSSKPAFARPVQILALLVGVVLLVACANLTALLLVRSVERSHEAGMRVALGASRLALFRQFFAESLMLAAIGGIAAWGVAFLLVKTLASYVAGQNPSLPAQVQPDSTVFGFSAAVTLAAAFLFGTWPAFQASKADPLPALHGASRGSRRRSLVYRGIVSAQVALSLVLLFCAGLFTRTLANLRGIDLGFQPENLVLVQPDLRETPHEGRGAYPFFEELLRRAEQVPGVRAASLGMFPPLSGGSISWTLTIPGYGTPGGQEPTAPLHYISGGYFRTMGIPLLAGEDLPRELDPESSGDVAIVNQEFARRFFGGQALGQTFKAGDQQLRIVGVVGTSKYRFLREEAQPIFYRPLGGPSAPVMLLVRTGGGSEPAMAQMRALVQSIDAGIRLNSVVTMEGQIDGVLSRERLLAFLSTTLGSVAITLSAIGLYGVLAFSVVRRTREVGIRMAIGATRSSVVTMFLKEAGWLVGAGVVLGVPLALLSGRAAESLLYGLQPQDAGTIAGATALLFAFAFAAAAIPAWRAARLNPLRALRHE